MTVFHHDGLYYPSDGKRRPDGYYKPTSRTPIPYKKIELQLRRNVSGESDQANYKEALLFFAAVESERNGYSNLYFNKEPREVTGCASAATATSLGTVSGNTISLSTVGGTMTECRRTTYQSFFAFNDMRFVKTPMLIVDEKCPTEVGLDSELRVGWDDKFQKMFSATFGGKRNSADFYDVKKILADLGKRYSTWGSYQRRENFNEFYTQICKESSFEIKKYKGES